MLYFGQLDDARNGVDRKLRPRLSAVWKFLKRLEVPGEATREKRWHRTRAGDISAQVARR